MGARSLVRCQHDLSLVLLILPASRRGRRVTDNPQRWQTQGWPGLVLCCIEPVAKTVSC